MAWLMAVREEGGGIVSVGFGLLIARRCRLCCASSLT